MNDITDKLAKFVRLLSSDQDGEVVAAAGAIRRVLLSANLDIHDLAKIVEKSGLGVGTKDSDWQRSGGAQRDRPRSKPHYEPEDHPFYRGRQHPHELAQDFKARASRTRGWGRTRFEEDEDDFKDDFEDFTRHDGPEPGPVDPLNYERANYCYQFRHTILNSREAEFVTDMSAQSYIRRLTPKQAAWLDAIWHKCQPFDFGAV